ncbi:hypothetical protein N7463_009791 [Penicillium fimorum]|uniref:Uncharacterized protein n=1 Tax=Penicillium fimorum TaxID=1882269 RepID=A0A9X0C168_9EURO|nr:hypothetical protein N7463_009791 [Penicillium fimorum]
MPIPASSSEKSSNGILANCDGPLEDATDATRPLKSCSVALRLRSIGTATATPSSASESLGPRVIDMRRKEVPELRPGLGVRPRLSIEGEMLIIGIRGKGGMGIDVAVDDIAGVENERLDSGVGDFGGIISSCVDTALRSPVAMLYDVGRALRSLPWRRRRERKNRSARIRARPMTETGTAMAIFVVLDGTRDKAVGSVIAEVVGAEVMVVEDAVWVDAREDRSELEGVVWDVGDGYCGLVVYSRLVGLGLASDALISLAVDVPVDSNPNSLRVGNESDPLEGMLDALAGSTKLDDSDALFLFCPPAVVVGPISWPNDATCEVSVYFDVLESGVSASSNIANGKNLIAGMVG